MKDYLCPSPTQEINNANRPEDASSDEDQEPVNENMEVEVSEEGSEGGSEGGDSDSGESQDDVGDQEDSQGRIVQHDVCRVDDEDPSPKNTEHDESEDSDKESLLRAPTLRLDDVEAPSPVDLSSSVASEEEWQDSQVSSNWLGKFYSKYGRFGKDENSDPNLPEYVKHDNRNEILQHIRDTFHGMDPEIAEQLCSNIFFVCPHLILKTLESCVVPLCSKLSP